MAHSSERPVVWLMIGIPYAGKSTYIAGDPLLSRLPVLSFDAEVMHVTRGHYERWADAVEEAGRRFEVRKQKLLAAGASFVIDMTNLRAEEGRRPLIRELHAAGFAVVGLVFPPPSADEILRRMAARPFQKVPPEVLLAMIERWQVEPPVKEEGFDELRWVTGSAL